MVGGPFRAITEVHKALEQAADRAGNVGKHETKRLAEGPNVLGCVPRTVQSMPVTVLLIEDYSSHRAMLHKVVAEMGCQTLEAADGRAGLALAAEHNPQLIVLDLVLPDIDGLEVLRRLRREALTAHTPILIVSAVDRLERLIEALAEGADDYVTKPYSAPVLQARMKVLLRAARLQQQLAEEARRAHAVAQLARAATTATDLESVGRQVAELLRAEGELAQVSLFAVSDDRLIGPLGPDGPVRDHPLVDLLREPSLGPVFCGEAPWVRRMGLRLGVLGRGCEHVEAAVVPLVHGDDVVAVAVAANETTAVGEQQVRRLATLSEAAGLALASAVERVRRAESESRYRMLFEQSADGVAVLHPSAGTLVQVNQTLAGWLSSLPAGLIGQAFTDLFDPGSRPAVAQALAAVANGRTTTLHDLRLRPADGGQFPVEVTLRCVRQGTSAGLLVLVHDLRNRDAVGLYQHASQDLGTLARTVRALNHSLNNPLTCIIGLAQLLQLRLSDQPEHQAPLDTILISAERIAEISRQLREVAISLAGDEPLENVEEMLTRLQVGKGA